ncbi:hypothetical protein [Streptomyces sp. NPDC006551]|uniref:hypothetical protein n=1 Tax=Streptomyces sp. NPDC006551 TaxID=3157178 RepID=UPI0033A2832A
MSRNITFRGQRAVPLPGDREMHGVMHDDERLRLYVADSLGSVLWEADLGDLGEDPSYQHADSRTSDYGCLYWETPDVLVILGDTAALVLSASTGTVVKSYPLLPVGKSSLEVSGITPVLDGRGLAITSAKRIWVIGPDLETAARFDSDSLFASVPSVEGDALVVEEYDFESPEGGKLTRRLPFGRFLPDRG